jgi:hypothetical protein
VRYRIAVLLGLAAALTAAAPALASVRPAVRIPAGASWQTCTPRATIEEGPYLLGNDLFAGRAGRLCIRAATTATTATIRVLTNVRWQPGGVAAAPYVRYGAWYGAGDPQAFLPQPASQARIVDHVTSNAPRRGTYLVDTDSYYYDSAADVSGYPAYELVIASRWHGWSGSGGRPVWFGRREWLGTEWETCPGVIPCHMLMLFRPVSQLGSLAENLTAFTGVLRRWGWLPAGTWLGSTCVQAELWSGGRGLRYGLRVIDTAPVIAPQGSR